MSVIDFAQKKLEKSAHVTAEAVCLGCRHEWEAVAPWNPGGLADFECPECKTMRGVLKYNYDHSEERFECVCGSEFWMLLISGPMCLGCGNRIPWEDFDK